MKSDDDSRRDRADHVMIEEIRRFQKQEPFHPFEIVMVDGRVHRVPHPDFIFVPPRGNWVYVTDADANTAHINILVISLVRRSRKRRKAG
ncbi:MAG: hypothetical protein U0637_04325 [Phycisphaerales bacterium]